MELKTWEAVHGPQVEEILPTPHGKVRELVDGHVLGKKVFATLLKSPLELGTSLTFSVSIAMVGNRPPCGIGVNNRATSWKSMVKKISTDLCPLLEADMESGEETKSAPTPSQKHSSLSRSWSTVVSGMRATWAPPRITIPSKGEQPTESRESPGRVRSVFASIKPMAPIHSTV